MMEFQLDVTAWEMALSKLRNGSTFSAVQFLTLLEQETEADFEDALEILTQKDILLDVSEIPGLPEGSELSVRLRHEKQLVQEGKIPQGLEENDPLRLYVEELAAIPVAGDVQVLAERYLNGDLAVQERLMNGMLSRVKQHAFALAGHSVLLMDLIQEGSLGVWQAILSYAGGDFEEYCDRWIQRALAATVVHQARENGVGQKMRKALEDYRLTDERLLAQLGRNPTMEEIADAMHITLQEAEMILQTMEAARSISRVKEAAMPREETPEDALAVEDTAYFQMRQRIGELLSILSEQEAQLLTLRFGLEGGLPLSPEDTARKLGMTPGEVLTVEAAALAKLRTM